MFSLRPVRSAHYYKEVYFRSFDLFAVFHHHYSTCSLVFLLAVQLRLLVTIISSLYSGSFLYLTLIFRMFSNALRRSLSR